MKTFLLEIGTEELPADFAEHVIAQLSGKVCDDLNSTSLKFGEIKCSTTPRRIVLLINDVAEFANDSLEVLKGPPSEQAFADGQPTKAALGFSKRCGISTDDLEVRETPKGPFVYAKIIKKGKSAYDLFSELIPNWIAHIQGRRFMRWGTGERRFSRPIRWLVSLLDEKLVTVNVDGCAPHVKSNTFTRGHRLYENNLSVNSAKEYLKLLANAGVIVDREERRSLIDNLINEASNELKASPDLPESLLNELTDLVESPSLIKGSFEDSYLNLPPEVLTTVMRVHQRYIPLYFNNKSNIDPLLLESRTTLLPVFLCISNGLIKSNETVRKGNQRVLKARLSDANFFIESDLSLTSEERLNLLKAVSFSEGLGSLYDRVMRIVWIVEVLTQNLVGPNNNPENTKRAALLCKHDLVSKMVGEFPELEGIIGGKYLLKEGESREVALAVLEHYLPRGSKDSVPTSDSGSILALAERFELLVSIFAKGERPTGSSDPFALRRAGNGIIQILFSKKWKIDIKQTLRIFLEYWFNMFPNFNINVDNLSNDLFEFFRQRIISQLEEEGIDPDLVEAVAGPSISISSLLSDPADILLRAELLSNMRKSEKLSTLQSVVIRASRLADKSLISTKIFGPSEVINDSLFERNSEKELLDLITSIEPIVNQDSNERYSLLVDYLINGAEILSRFFDGDQSVMVMSDDLLVRTNRLNLLAIIRNQAYILADFSKISG